MDEDDARLLAEQMSHTLDLLNSRIAALESRLAHQYELANLRLSALEHSRRTRRPACGRRPTRWCA